MYTREGILTTMEDYGAMRDPLLWPVPTESDLVVFTLVRGVGDPGSYREVLWNLTRYQMSTLEAFGLRACVWAEQERFRELLVCGLVALARVFLSDPQADFEPTPDGWRTRDPGVASYCPCISPDTR